MEIDFSIDKVRLRLYVPEHFAAYIIGECFRLGLAEREDVKVGGDFAYRYGVTVHDGTESNLWFAFDHIKENKGELEKVFVIDFNPNKHSAYGPFFTLLRSALKCFKWSGPYIKSVDLAFDFPGRKMEEVKVSVKKVRKANIHQGTQYWGRREVQVKKYDKAQERKDRGKRLKVDDMVRVEVTRPFKGHLSLFEKDRVSVSGVYVSLADDGDIILRSLSHSLAVGYISECELTKYYKKRIREYNAATSIDLQGVLNENWARECDKLRSYFDLAEWWELPVSEGYYPPENNAVQVDQVNIMDLLINYNKGVLQ